MSPVDPSSLRYLTPQEACPLSYAPMTFNAQNVGSLQWLLRKASRTPEHSRPYQAGDPLRLIDWRAFARTDHLIVRERHEEASAQVLLVVVRSDSMLWPDESLAAISQERHPTKWEIALRLCLHLAYNHLRAGDHVRLLSLDPDAGLAAAQGLSLRSPAQVLQIYEHAVAHDFAAEALDHFLQGQAPTQRQFDLCYLATDGFRMAGVWPIAAMAKVCRLWHVLSDLELDDAWLDPRYAYVDDRVNHHREYLGEVLSHHHAFARKMETWRQGLVAEAARRLVTYQLVTPLTSVVDFHRELSLESHLG